MAILAYYIGNICIRIAEQRSVLVPFTEFPVPCIPAPSLSEEIISSIHFIMTFH